MKEFISPLTNTHIHKILLLLPVRLLNICVNTVKLSQHCLIRVLGCNCLTVWEIHSLAVLLRARLVCILNMKPQ